jgi:transposase
MEADRTSPADGRTRGLNERTTVASSAALCMCDCPPEYGPPTTIYNRFLRWARRGVWDNLFRELAGNERSTDTQVIDSTRVKAHRSAAGGKGRAEAGCWPLARRA